MSLTQYLVAWTIYLLAAAGCLLVWWKITHILNARLASWLRLWATVAVLVPGFTNQDMTWMTPALPATLYDLLTGGPESLARNGLILIGALTIASMMKLLFFRNTHKAKSKNSEKQKGRQERQEPHVSTDKLNSLR